MGQEIVFPVLKTERLILRKITETDASSIYTYLSDPEVMKYYGLEPFQSVQDALAEISWYESIFKEQTGIRWGISLKDSDRIIGSCGFLNTVSSHYRTDIGFEVSKEYWGQGIGSEAIMAIIHYAFEHMNIQRIQALIEPPNIASQKMVEKAGFLREGLLRKYEYACGKFDDLYMYGLLKEDYKL
ncbi:GNAT family N-acetyltransferase [Ureibacillus sinduriensis]|uniref:Alanine acetyltransferase n=1 Tax=Ureibacillus sinduriensis BLB-1 = JCM 15800 TaxID=1384057 RepID=A0A0A3HWU2_9BACL|nr:GNAT family protein [Ureibacillus sinduriensis]KGR77086.1 alanine acetyltransferase [Ureibacillus sinduriensis BLB-1 = JCM 15800]